jgi:hypothetical protein
LSRPLLIKAEHPFCFLFYYPYHSPFRLPLFPLFPIEDFYNISLEGTSRITGRNKNIIRTPSLRANKTISSARGNEPSFYYVGLGGDKILSFQLEDDPQEAAFLWAGYIVPWQLFGSSGLPFFS